MLCGVICSAQTQQQPWVYRHHSRCRLRFNLRWIKGGRPPRVQRDRRLLHVSWHVTECGGCLASNAVRPRVSVFLLRWRGPGAERGVSAWFDSWRSPAQVQSEPTELWARGLHSSRFWVGHTTVSYWNRLIHSKVWRENSNLATPPREESAMHSMKTGPQTKRSFNKGGNINHPVNESFFNLLIIISVLEYLYNLSFCIYNLDQKHSCERDGWKFKHHREIYLYI